MKINFREVSFFPASGDIHHAVSVDIGQPDAVGALGGIVDTMAVPRTIAWRSSCGDFG